jgi:HEAT repeat protein
VESFLATALGSSPSGFSANDTECLITGTMAVVGKKPELRAAFLSSPIAEHLLIDVLERGGHNHRIRAASVLGDLQSAKAVPPLLRMLRERDDDLRIGAINALGCIRSAASTQAVTEALQDKNTNVRWGAVNALGNLRSQETAEALIDLVISEPEETVKNRAIYTLITMGSAKVADILTSYVIGHTNSQCRARALEALGQIRPPDRNGQPPK